MNDRIKKLAEQAGMRTVTYEYDEDTYFTDSLDPQKFAELIVQECISAAEDAQADFYVINNIKTRFGVKE